MVSNSVFDAFFGAVIKYQGNMWKKKFIEPMFSICSSYDRESMAADSWIRSHRELKEESRESKLKVVQAYKLIKSTSFDDFDALSLLRLSFSMTSLKKVT